MLPADVHPDSRNRLPLVRRDDLDEAGRESFDRAANDPKSLVGLQGPGGIRLHDPALNAISQPVNRYLRFGAGLDPRTVEIAILTTARLLESRFEWCAHEPVARELGVGDATIDAMRTNGSLEGVPADDARVIRLVREAVADHRVAPETFADALAHFGAKTLLNVVALVGNYMATAVLLTVFDQQLPEGKTAAF
jgi:4-carboxymuconolactone decarboxylase